MPFTSNFITPRDVFLKLFSPESMILFITFYQEFINAGVNAYALGCTDEGLRKELIDMENSGAEIEGLETYGGGTSLRFKILSEEVRLSKKQTSNSFAMCFTIIILRSFC